ncbi:hypothetical protein F5Y00DRAFT_106596 [Daldinia vernicosa]|uniref:uncharacterized protein n=1 Tax=Daldinia vernicosa TaxID=114800 RepID=UPI0020076879|nr:uncharacterized protein F5Y00DRAFT_106596 [Daldinia vernicosa]KAI0847877.1 hypothetical protein F5Y00DRAFT_106596 [Daldinia vernicosa]
MSSDNKGRIPTPYSDVDPQDHQYQSHVKKLRLVDSARIGLTGLALLCGLTILGTAADTLAVYNATHLSSDYHLPLWPDQFDLRPTVALVVGSTIVVIANIVSLLCSKVRVLRNQTSVHTPLTFAAPFVGFTAVMIGMIFFYAVNTSATNDTLQSWSCQWGFASMGAKPHFGTLCNESRVALYLSVILVPVELIVFTIAGYQSILEKKALGFIPSHKTGSPVPSA